MANAVSTRKRAGNDSRVGAVVIRAHEVVYVIDADYNVGRHAEVETSADGVAPTCLARLVENEADTVRKPSYVSLAAIAPPFT